MMQTNNMKLDETTGREYEEVEHIMHGQKVVVRRFTSGPSKNGLTYNTLDMFSRMRDMRDTSDDRNDVYIEQEELKELVDAAVPLTNLFKQEEPPF